MTVCFLGWTPPERVEEAQAVIQAIEPRQVKIRLLPAPVAKPPRRPSLFAIEAEASEATTLAEEVASRYRKLGPRRGGEAPVLAACDGRARRLEKGRARPRRRRPLQVERPPEPLPEVLGGEFEAVRLCLYRSMMRRDGSQYVPLCNLNLR